MIHFCKKKFFPFSNSKDDKIVWNACNKYCKMFVALYCMASFDKENSFCIMEVTMPLGWPNLYLAKSYKYKSSLMSG